MWITSLKLWKRVNKKWIKGHYSGFDPDVKLEEAANTAEGNFVGADKVTNHLANVCNMV
jgi:hypothetical protein